MAYELDSRLSGLGLSPVRGYFVVFLGKTLYSHGASLYPGVLPWSQRLSFILSWQVL